MQILTAIPLWVLPLFLALLLIGLRARKERSTPVIVLCLLPLLGVLSLMRGLALGPVALAALALGWTVGVWIGASLQPRWTLARTGSRVHLRGESVTLVTMLTLFAANFAGGMVQGMAPEVASGPVFGLGWGLLAGLLSGSYAGRALAVLRLPSALA